MIYSSMMNNNEEPNAKLDRITDKTLKKRRDWMYVVEITARTSMKE